MPPTIMQTSKVLLWILPQIILKYLMNQETNLRHYRYFYDMTLYAIRIHTSMRQSLWCPWFLMSFFLFFFLCVFIYITFLTWFVFQWILPLNSVCIRMRLKPFLQNVATRGNENFLGSVFNMKSFTLLNFLSLFFFIPYSYRLYHKIFMMIFCRWIKIRNC